jgi:hypothetical protein
MSFSGLRRSPASQPNPDALRPPAYYNPDPPPEVENALARKYQTPPGLLVDIYRNNHPVENR